METDGSDGEDWAQGGVEPGAGERISLDTPSKFTLTQFRRSKFTRMMLWFVSILGLGSAG